MTDHAFHARAREADDLPEGDAPRLAGHVPDDDGAFIDDLFEAGPPSGVTPPTLPTSTRVMSGEDIATALKAYKGGKLLTGSASFSTGADPAQILTEDPGRIALVVRCVSAQPLRRGGIPMDVSASWTTASQTLPIPAAADPTLTPWILGYKWATTPTADAIAVGWQTIRLTTLAIGASFTDRMWWCGSTATPPTPTVGCRDFEPMPGNPGGRAFLAGGPFEGGASVSNTAVQVTGYALPASGKPFSLTLSDDKGMANAAGAVEVGSDPIILEDYTGQVWAAPMPSGIAATPQTIPNMTLQWWSVVR